MDCTAARRRGDPVEELLPFTGWTSLARLLPAIHRARGMLGGVVLLFWKPFRDSHSSVRTLGGVAEPLQGRISGPTSVWEPGSGRRKRQTALRCLVSIVTDHINVTSLVVVHACMDRNQSHPHKDLIACSMRR